jgi:hypothetical protein
MDLRKCYELGRAELLAIHRDESGENNMSTVMILAIAAFVGAGIFLFGKSIYQYASDRYKEYTAGGKTKLANPE